MLDVTRETASFTLPDGVRLDADVWRPGGVGPWPVLLMRQPYGRDDREHGRVCASGLVRGTGYIVVIQDVRGRGTSTGAWRLLEHERADGAASVAVGGGVAGQLGRRWGCMGSRIRG